MYHQTDLTQQVRDHNLALRREAEERRLARQLRGARLSRSTRTADRRPGSVLGHAFALWGRINVPFGA